eukprot:scaffold7380_cov240-Pinguiococcus_pyrenoidosus.AAC.5
MCRRRGPWEGRGPAEARRRPPLGGRQQAEAASTAAAEGVGTRGGQGAFRGRPRDHGGQAQWAAGARRARGARRVDHERRRPGQGGESVGSWRPRSARSGSSPRPGEQVNPGAAAGHLGGGEVCSGGGDPPQVAPRMLQLHATGGNRSGTIPRAEIRI